MEQIAPATDAHAAPCLGSAPPASCASSLVSQVPSGFAQSGVRPRSAVAEFRNVTPGAGIVDAHALGFGAPLRLPSSPSPLYTDLRAFVQDQHERLVEHLEIMCLHEASRHAKGGLTEAPGERATESGADATMGPRAHDPRAAALPPAEEHAPPLLGVLEEHGLTLHEPHARQKNAVEVARRSAQEVAQLRRMVTDTGLHYFTPIVRDRRFDVIISFLILANLILVGAEVENDGDMPEAMVLCQIALTVMFYIELAMRLEADRLHFFFNRMWVWNCLDCVLVVMVGVEIGFRMATQAEGGRSMNIIRVLRMTRVTRILRLLRIARVLRYVRELSILMSSIRNTLKSLLWSLVLLTLFMYLFGIFFTVAVGEYLKDADFESDECMEAGPAGRPSCELLAQFWGTVPRSMFTLLEAITGGVDWDTVSRPLAQVSWVWLGIFILYICFAQFAVLNVVTGVFCHKAIESAQRDRELMIQELLENKHQYVNIIQSQFAALYKVFDSDGSGGISLQEFQMHLKRKEVQAFMALLELDVSDAYTLFTLLDADGTGNVDPEEFVDGCLRLKGHARSIDLAILHSDVRSISQKLGYFVQGLNGAGEKSCPLARTHPLWSAAGRWLGSGEQGRRRESKPHTDAEVPAARGEPPLEPPAGDRRPVGRLPGPEPVGACDSLSSLWRASPAAALAQGEVPLVVGA